MLKKQFTELQSVIGIFCPGDELNPNGKGKESIRSDRARLSVQTNS